MNIGLRTIKTGIAVSIAMIISVFFETGNPFYVIIAAIIAMQPTVSDSWRIGLNRMLGTFLGAIIGVVFAYAIPVNPITTGIGIVVLITILNRFNWRESISIGSVVFIGIFLNEGSNHFQYASGRLLDTSIGIGVAVIVNYLIYPPTYDNKIIKEINGTSKHIWNYIYNILEIYLEQKHEGIEILDEEIAQIEKVLSKSKRFLELQIKEEKVLIYGKYKCNDLLSFITGADEIYQNVLNIDRIFQTGIKTEVINLIHQDFTNIKESIAVFINKEILILGAGNEAEEEILQLLQRVKQAKVNIKFNERINEYPTDDVVKVLVLLYNLEEILKKLKLMKGYHEGGSIC